jgi:hypothetical protein
VWFISGDRGLGMAGRMIKKSERELDQLFEEVMVLSDKINRVCEKQKVGIVIGAFALLIAQWMKEMVENEGADFDELIEIHSELVKYHYEGLERKN